MLSSARFICSILSASRTLTRSSSHPWRPPSSSQPTEEKHRFEALTTCAPRTASQLTFLIGRPSSFHAESFFAYLKRLFLYRCLIVKTDPYNQDQIAKVLQLRANVEGLKLGQGVLDRLSAEGEKTSLRSVKFSLFPI
jgi:hypothetical protein